MIKQDKNNKSPLAPDNFPDLMAIDGVKISTEATGVKYKDRDDLLVIEFVEGTQVAGALTRSLTCSHAVNWCKRNLPAGSARALIVNAGNANAFTGKLGETAVNECINAVADNLACRPSRVFPASTGVIGEFLPYELITSAIPVAFKRMSSPTPDTWARAASAILTTDTFPKGSTRITKIGDIEVSISGISKGSGMIAPNMATLLAFIFTDADIPAPILQGIVDSCVTKTFNSITVDSDTSTSDTLLVFATGACKAKLNLKEVADPRLADFKKKLESVMLDLAQQIIRDGEGASKFISIEVTGAEHNESARKIGLSIANSPLFKTAIAGEDANWGRIVMGIGKSGELIVQNKIEISIGGIQITKNGAVIDTFDESELSKYMKNSEIEVEINLGLSDGEATVWTCDLTHGYISINADYRS